MIFENVAGQVARETFARFYTKRGDGAYASASTEWTDDRQQMVQILADAGFSMHYPEYSRVEQAREIVEELLKREPKNAEAWMVYLTHFWRFSFAARGHWFGTTVFSTPLRKAIASAYANCPTDARISAWYEAMLKDGLPPGLHPENPGVIADAWKNEFTTEE